MCVGVLSLHCLFVVGPCLLDVLGEQQSLFVDLSQVAASLGVIFLSLLVVSLQALGQILLLVDAVDALVGLVERTGLSISNLDGYFPDDLNFLDNFDDFFLRPLPFQDLPNELILCL